MGKKYKKQFYTEDQVNAMDGTVLGSTENTKLEPSELPDPIDIAIEVEKIIERISSDEMILLEQKDKEEYGNKLEEEFPEFSKKYFSLFLTIISREDISNLTDMLLQLDQIKNHGKSYKDAEKELGENLSKQYIKEKK